jgi:hypothetical protein
LEYAAIALAMKHINKYAGTIPVILARHYFGSLMMVPT